jgi:hypothetical protein
MAEPLVSVLITTHNRAATLDRAIRSVLVQTLQDFEIIIVDDASMDATPGVLEAWQGHPRIRIHRNPANLGEFANRNRAASFATGRYLKFVDSDDAIYPYALEYMTSALEAVPEAGLALSGGTPPGWQVPCALRPEGVFLWQALGPGRILGANGPTFTCMRRTVFESAGGFPELRTMGDHALWMRMAALADVLFLPGGMAFSALSQVSETTDPYCKSPEALVARNRIVSDALAHPTCPLDPVLARKLRRRTLEIGAANLIRLAWGGHRTLAFAARGLRAARSGPLSIARGFFCAAPAATLPSPRRTPVRLRTVDWPVPAALDGEPVVSVILRGEAGSAAAADSVASVLGQSLPRFELLMATAGAGAGPAGTDPRVRAAPDAAWADSSGIEAARASRSALLMFLRPGDRLQPHALAVLAGALARHPSAVMSVSMRDSRRILLPMVLPAEQASRMEHHPRHPLLTEGIPAVCVRRDPFLAAGGFPGPGEADEVAGWLRILGGLGDLVAVPGDLARRPEPQRDGSSAEPFRGTPPAAWKPVRTAGYDDAAPDWAAFPGARTDQLGAAAPHGFNADLAESRAP